MAQYRKRPMVIEAVQMPEPFTTQTMEGELSGKAGDWLITGVKGEQYPCDDGVFRQTYDAVGETDSDFEKAVGKAREWCTLPPYVQGLTYDSDPQVDTDELDDALDAMAAAHAEVVAERDALKAEAAIWEEKCRRCAYNEHPFGYCWAIEAIEKARREALAATEEEPDDHATGTEA